MVRDMVKNFIPNCDLCGREILEGKYPIRRVPVDGIELLMVLLENSDPDLELRENPDGTLDLDTCLDCYTRMAFSYSHAVN